MPVASFVWLIDFYERAVLNGCAHEVSSGSRHGTIPIVRSFPRSPMPIFIQHDDGPA
jgi:hypothetical protein